jgi:hypothetical protein
VAVVLLFTSLLHGMRLHEFVTATRARGFFFVSFVIIFFLGVDPWGFWRSGCIDWDLVQGNMSQRVKMYATVVP